MAEQQARLPYFYSYGSSDSEKRAVLCPKCSFDQHVSPELLMAHYFTDRALLCGHCNILIGPVNPEEMSHE